MEIRKLDAAQISFKNAIEIADVALDAFRDDPLYAALNMRYGQEHYARARLSYALLLAAKMWRQDVRVWVALEDQRVVGLCRWEKLNQGSNGVSRVWIWIADAARWLLDLYASIFEPPQTRPPSQKAVAAYFGDVSQYFKQAVPSVESTAYLGLLCARESCKGRGVGSALLTESMRDILADQPSTKFSLWSTVAGLGLYKKHGFEVRAEHNAYLNGKPQRQVLMLK